MQRAEFETKLNRVCLHIYKEEHYEEDYQMPMLRQNRLEGILEVEGCEVGGEARYTYEISGLLSMKTMYENSCIKKKEIETVIARILEVTEILQCYMLNPNCLVLKPEYIFYKEGKWYFCYFPGMEEDLCKLFHELTEYFVKMLDYQDTEGIFLAYELHKATLQEHYDLELIMKEYKSRESERKKMIRERHRPVKYKRENKEKSSQNPDSIETNKEKTENTGYYYKKKEGIEAQYKKHGGDEYIRQGSAGYSYGKKDDMQDAGDDYGWQDSGGYKEEKQRHIGYGYEVEGNGNIFSVADEDENERNPARSIFEKREQIYTADTIREDSEDGGGGWWKSWRKAANGIRRKRWGSWDDLILETDGQEEES